MLASNRWISVSAGVIVGLLSFGSSSFAADSSPGLGFDRPAADEMEFYAEDLSSEDFLQSIHIVNLAEIDMGQLSMDKSQDKDIRDYGRIIVRDHRLTDEALRFIADQKDISLNNESFTELTVSLKQNLDQGMTRLQGASPEDFRAVLSEVAIAGHQQTLDLIKRAQSEVSDRGVRVFAFLIEPVIQSHLKMAQKLQAEPQPQ